MNWWKKIKDKCKIDKYDLMVYLGIIIFILLLISSLALFGFVIYEIIEVFI